SSHKRTSARLSGPSLWLLLTRGRTQCLATSFHPAPLCWANNSLKMKYRSGSNCGYSVKTGQLVWTNSKYRSSKLRNTFIAEPPISPRQPVREKVRAERVNNILYLEEKTVTSIFLSQPLIVQRLIVSIFLGFRFLVLRRRFEVVLPLD